MGSTKKHDLSVLLGTGDGAGRQGIARITMKEKDFGIESSKRKEAHRGWNALAAGSLAAAAAFSLGGCGDSASAEQSGAFLQSGTTQVETQSGASETPESSPTESTEREGVEKLRISAELSPEETAQGITDLWMAWGFEDATPEEAESSYNKFMDESNPSSDLDAFATTLAQQNAELYAPALLGDDWSDDEVRTSMYNSMVAWNAEKISSAIGQFSRGEAISSMVQNVSDVEEFNSWNDTINNGSVRYSQAAVEELEKTPEKERFYEYTMTPEWTNPPSGLDNSVYRVGIALRVEDNGTLTLIEKQNQELNK